jgi:TP53 regulating kinase and related kinases
MEKKLIKQGAEAKIYLDSGKIIKERFSKKYRIPEIDIFLRKTRTRREAKIFEKLKKTEISCPELFESDDKKMTISMSFIDGELLKDAFSKSPLEFSEEIGKKTGIMHKNSIIHADLTTSNMILHKNKIYFIDFGLSFFSEKEEDKAVDLHLLDRALESRHYEHYPKIKKAVITGYKKGNPEYKKVLERLKKVESRGRNKNK